MRWVAALLVCAACSSDTGRGDAAQALSLDVFVTAQTVAIRTHGTDATCDCNDESWGFAEIGTCFGIDDVACRCPEPSSCMATWLSGTGLLPDPTRPQPQLTFAVPDPWPSDLALRISGCGISELGIPLEPFTAPAPTVNANVSGNTITAQWQTDTPAASAYVTFGFSLWAQECHTTTNEQTYVLPGSGPPPPATIGVMALLPVVAASAPHVDVRVWRGAASYVHLQP